jgi:hypothetical protein
VLSPADLRLIGPGSFDRTAFGRLEPEADAGVSFMHA